MPPFELEGGVTLTLWRAASVATLLSAFGVLVFGAVVAPRASAGAPAEVVDRLGVTLVQLCRISLLLAFSSAALWLVAESGQLAGTTDFASALHVVPTVLSTTLFGHIIAVRLIALVGALMLLRSHPSRLRWWSLTVLCGAIVCLQAAHSHAMAMNQGPSVLLASQILHLLAAGAWLGGLLPLLLVVRLAPPKIGALACRWFSPLGQWCIAGIMVSAAWQYWQLVGGPIAMIGTAHGWTDGAKTFLLLVLLGFAALNRYRLAPALLHAEPLRTRRLLLRSLALQTLVGLIIVFVAAVLSSLPPAIHEQPLWPFPWGASLAALSEPELRDEVEIASSFILAGIAVALAGAFSRRLRVRWLLIIVGFALVVWHAGSFALLFVPAYPTSYYSSPSGFSVQSIGTGMILYGQYCTSCHGADGQGDGPAAKGLVVPPADLTAAHLWAHSDGELFWWLGHGMLGPHGGLVMPGFADRLSDDELWALIDFIRARNAGLALSATGSWPATVAAPDFPIVCNNKSMMLSDLRGGVVRIATRMDGTMIADVPDATLVVLQQAGSAGKVCATDSPDVWSVYALIVGEPLRDFPGTELLVDQAGWLRTYLPPDDVATDDLVEDVARIRSSSPPHPISVGHQHH